MATAHGRRRAIFTLLIAVISLISAIFVTINLPTNFRRTETTAGDLASLAIKRLSIKGRSSKTGYSRSQFGSGWSSVHGCDTRNIILNRDLRNIKIDSNCNVIGGVLDDPYSGSQIIFKRASREIDIDHVVALSDAWQKGAQSLDKSTRIKLANDPINLLAVSSNLNIQKGDSDAASWLPPNKAFRCQYVARQISVKLKYHLWISLAEYNAINAVLNKCPDELLPEA